MERHPSVLWISNYTEDRILIELNLCTIEWVLLSLLLFPYDFSYYSTIIKMEFIETRYVSCTVRWGSSFQSMRVICLALQ